MTPQQYSDYLYLLHKGLMGRVWTPDDKGGWRIAPVDALPGLEWALAEPVSLEWIIKEIGRLMGIKEKRLPERIGVQSESESMEGGMGNDIRRFSGGF